MHGISRRIIANKGINYQPNYRINKNNRSMSVTTEPKNEDEIKKSVLISQSNDIFTNLALEDWYYRNYDFNNHHILLLWKNNPCVVIGRHQNPWLEANCRAINENKISLSRRNSGGGTVYHDLENLNLSFFTQKSRYNRRYNLEIITRALYREFMIETFINKRDDIVTGDDLKVSGTAAKLGRATAYHHCTLLGNADKTKLAFALQRKETGITTNATVSIKSPIKNLHDIDPRVNTDTLMSAIGWEYLRTKAITLEHVGLSSLQKLEGFKMINPTEESFPGLDRLKSEFESWDWNYGKTPKFIITRHLKFPGDFNLVSLIVDVQNGIISDIKVDLPPNLSGSYKSRVDNVISSFQSSRYNYDFVDNFCHALGCQSVFLDGTDCDNTSALIQ